MTIQLQGHYLWNGAQAISRYLQRHVADLVCNKTILELGAGAGLPSLVAAINGASQVVVTDYPDADLIENLQKNIDACSPLNKDGHTNSNIIAKGYLWGADTQPLLKQLPGPAVGFDMLILADLLFNHHCHDALVRTVLLTLSREEGARALVFFTPYRPWLLEKDLAFFALCEQRGLVVEKLLEEVVEKVMFEEDPGDELTRRTVFGYEVMWPASSTELTETT